MIAQIDNNKYWHNIRLAFRVGMRYIYKPRMLFYSPSSVSSSINFILWPSSLLFSPALLLFLSSSWRHCKIRPWHSSWISLLLWYMHIRQVVLTQGAASPKVSFTSASSVCRWTRFFYIFIGRPNLKDHRDWHSAWNQVDCQSPLATVYYYLRQDIRPFSLKNAYRFLVLSSQLCA